MRTSEAFYTASGQHIGPMLGVARQGTPYQIAVTGHTGLIERERDYLAKPCELTIASGVSRPSAGLAESGFAFGHDDDGSFGGVDGERGRAGKNKREQPDAEREGRL